MAANDACRVAVVDDNDDVRLLLRISLEADERFEWAGEAVDGGAGVELVIGSVPDAVILDVEMPVMDGRAALQALRERGYPGVIVLYSSDLGVAGRARELGADAGFTKVDRIEVVLDEVSAQCAARSAGDGSS